MNSLINIYKNTQNTQNTQSTLSIVDENKETHDDSCETPINVANSRKPILEHCNDYEILPSTASGLSAKAWVKFATGLGKQNLQLLHNNACESNTAHYLFSNRTISSAPFPNGVTPPAPRLVGIETNPGPTEMEIRMPRIVRKAPQTLGKAIKAAAEREVHKTIGKKSTRIATHLISDRGGRPKSAAGKPSEKVALSHAPVASNAITRFKTGRHTVSEAFTSSRMYVVSTGPNVLWFAGEPSAQVAATHIDLNPQYCLMAGGQVITDLLGQPIQLLSQAFLHWRFKSLTLEYKSAVGTSTTGEVVFGYLSDPYITATPTYPQVAAINGSLSGPTWTATRRIMPVNVSKDWFFVHEGNNTTESSNQRITSAGALTVAGFGCPSGTTALGIITLSGVIEFMDLVPVLGQGPNLSSNLGSYVWRTQFQTVLDTSHTLAEPFGNTAPRGIDMDFSGDPSVELPLLGPNRMTFRVAGKYRVRMFVLDVTGTITVGINASSYSNAIEISETASTVAPYPYDLTLATSANGYAVFAGLTTATAGTLFAIVDYLGAI